MSYSRTAAHQRFSAGTSLVPPTGGINDIDPLANMDPAFCLDLVNWYPTTADLASRSGYAEWAINVPGNIGTLMPFKQTDGSEKLFAVSDQGIYDVTDKVDGPVEEVACSVNGASFTQFATVASTYLVVVNGQDSGWLYNGTDWTPFTEADPADAPGKIKGIDPSMFKSVISYKRRLWFVEKDSMTAWYLPTDAVAGEAKPFYLGSIFRKGGYLRYMAPWSMDAGEDLEDRLMFASSTGELAIYVGNDPETTTDWKLDAVFTVAAPIGDKAYTELGGDILMLTRGGLIPLSRVVSGEANAALFEASVSKRISRTLSSLVNVVGFVDNWELHNVLFLQAIVIIVPAVGGSPSRQYVMNVLTGAWTKFDLPADSFSNFKEKAFIASGSTVYQFGGVNLDNVKFDNSGGVPIQCKMFSAYNYLDNPGSLKHFKMVRPIFQSTNSPSYSLRINVDFDLQSLPAVPPNPGGGGGTSLWDVALWDDAIWSTTNLISRPWSGVNGLGYAAALIIKVAANNTTRFSAAQILYENGMGL